MILRYLGHSMFILAMENGFTLVTDPYGSFYTYPKRNMRADAVTVSHYHHDHDAIECISGDPFILDQAGVVSPVAGLSVTGIESQHDAEGGAKRGRNLIFVIETEGLRIVHLGDLGHILLPRQRKAIGKPDVLMSPVGGTYTTDAFAAFENVRLLKPRITVPMHYRTPFSDEMPIDTEEGFIALFGEMPEPMSVCRLTKNDISERRPLLRMAVTP